MARCTAVLAGDQPLRTVAAIDGALWTGDVAGRLTRWTHGADGWTHTAQWHAHTAAIRRLRDVGGALASCGEDGFMRVWDTGSLVGVFAAQHAGFVTDVLRQGAALVTSSYDGRIARHDHIAATLA